MAKKALQLDEVGCWSEIKLDIIKEYASAYSTILANQPAIKGHVYVDALAGAGVHVSKATGAVVFFKQWGGVFKKRTGRELNGRTWDEMPRALPLASH